MAEMGGAIQRGRDRGSNVTFICLVSVTAPHSEYENK